MAALASDQMLQLPRSGGGRLGQRKRKMRRLCRGLVVRPGVCAAPVVEHVSD